MVYIIKNLLGLILAQLERVQMVSHMQVLFVFNDLETNRVRVHDHWKILILIIQID